MIAPARRRILILKGFLWLLLSGPTLYLAYYWQALVVTGDPGPMGANPIEYTTRLLGDHALRFLVLTLAVTSVSRLIKKPWIVGARRMVGLFAFAMVVLHMLSYVVLDLYFDWMAIGRDILKRNFITVGLLSFLMLLPLAVTSTKAMVKRVGAKRWQKLHSLIYFINILVVIHYAMMVRGNRIEPLIYMMIVAVLMLERYFHARKTLK